MQLKPGARVADAVDAAGGAGADADLSRLNLARTVSDGEQVVVPRPGDPDPVGVSTAPGNSAIAGAPAAPPSTGEAATGPAAAVVNLNTATQAELDGLPGIGPVLAARIVEWRTSNGPFTAVDELGEVGGIGDKLLAQLHDKVTV